MSNKFIRLMLSCEKSKFYYNLYYWINNNMEYQK